jgi:hypothetical protein
MKIGVRKKSTNKDEEISTGRQKGDNTKKTTYEEKRKTKVRKK